MATKNYGAMESLVGIMLETLFYGGFLIVSWECLISLRRRARDGKAHWYMTCTFAVLFICISMRTIIDLKRTIVSFTHPSDQGLIDLGGPRTVESLMTNALLVVIAVVADAFLIYRVHIVWQSGVLVIILPVLLLLGTAGGGVMVIYALYNASVSNPITFLLVNQGFEVFLSFTVACNAVCSLLIAGRILWIRRKSSAQGTTADAVSKIVAVMVESAALYTAVLVAEIIAITRSSPLNFLFINWMGPLIGLVFAYIIIRAARHSRSWENSDSYTSHGPSTPAVSANLSGGHPHARSLGGPHSATRSRPPVQIQLETFKEVSHDPDTDLESATGARYGSRDQKI
ncbi:hypothetical protein BKA62DRAFT_697632 [Auriculariales sp. MPI-PUGE-AT-0066]|nr:hypothetical protein BKA62DRAFT_697632 [Auriculariales sp. MPI-PUGE-AT-0066]